MRLITLITLMCFSLHGKAIVYQGDSAKDRLEKGKIVMKEVFNRFHTNYEMTRLNKMGYYQETVSDSNSTYYLAESIVDIYIPSNLNHSDNASIYPIKTRKKEYKTIDAEKLLFGNASDMARSSIWRPHSFLNEKNRDKYIYAYTGNNQLNGKEVIVISFSPKEGGHGNVSGNIYIDPTYYGILKIEYTPLIEDTFVWREVYWSENFEFRDGSYELIHVKFEGISSFDGFRYQAILAIGQTVKVNQIPDYILFIDDNTPLFEKAQESSAESFWKGFEFLKYLKPSASHLVANK